MTRYTTTGSNKQGSVAPNRIPTGPTSPRPSSASKKQTSPAVTKRPSAASPSPKRPASPPPASGKRAASDYSAKPSPYTQAPSNRPAANRNGYSGPAPRNNGSYAVPSSGKPSTARPKSRTAAGPSTKPSSAKAGAPKSAPQKQPPKKAVKTNKRKSKFIRNVLWVLVLVLAFVLLGTWRKCYYTDIVVEGVYVDGTSLYGMTYEDVRALLEQNKQQKLSMMKIHVEDPATGQTWDWGAQDIGADIHLDPVMEQVTQAGRTGNVFRRKEQVKELLSYPLFITTQISFDGAKVQPLVNSISAQLNTDPSNAQMQFDPNKSEKWIFVNEVYGKKVDEAQLLQNILDDLADDSVANVQVFTQSVAPEVTVDQLRQNTQNKVMFRTAVSGSKNRKHNVKQALQALNGKVLKPGEELSFNATTGERTEANGYLEAPVIGANKGFEPALGGGVCQVSTTLYNAALMADCTIVKWRSHSFPSTYVDKGLDAVVNWPEKDLVIRNDTDSMMYIQAVYYDDQAEVVIYRKPFDNGIDKIRLTSTVVVQKPVPERNIVPDQQAKYVIYDDEHYDEVVSRPYTEVRNTQQFIKGSEIVEEKEIHVVKFQEIVGVRYVGVTPASQRPGGAEPTGGSND